MLFGLSHREKRVKKINLLHFQLKLPEPSTDFVAILSRTLEHHVFVIFLKL